MDVGLGNFSLLRLLERMGVREGVQLCLVGPWLDYSVFVYWIRSFFLFLRDLLLHLISSSSFPGQDFNSCYKRAVAYYGVGLVGLGRIRLIHVHVCATSNHMPSAVRAVPIGQSGLSL